ncbi:MAG: STAS domain-containing protein [Deltaproteobacteria bacterium]|nr:STAS domain-containing protein [Deltaproteobacteria bacterium]
MLKKNMYEGLVWFSLSGEVGLTDVAGFLREMSKEITNGNKIFVLDISDGEHIRRHSFDALINIKEKLRKSGVRLIIVCCKKILIDILNVERVTEHFEVVSDSSLVKNQFSFSQNCFSYRN